MRLFMRRQSWERFRRSGSEFSCITYYRKSRTRTLRSTLDHKVAGVFSTSNCMSGMARFQHVHRGIPIASRPVLQVYELLVRSAYSRGEAGLCSEIAFNGFQLSILDSQILDIPERLTVLGVAEIFHKGIVGPGGDSLQVKMFNEIDLCIPALCLESALANVVVAGGAREREIVGKQHIERAQVLPFPRPVPLADDLLVR